MNKLVKRLGGARRRTMSKPKKLRRRNLNRRHSECMKDREYETLRAAQWKKRVAENRESRTRRLRRGRPTKGVNAKRPLDDFVKWTCKGTFRESELE